MMKFDLPKDVVEEILSRVPAKSLKRLRSTCKLWNSLFTDKGFTEKHCRNAPKQSLVLMLKELRVGLNTGASHVDFKGALALEDSHSNPQQVDISTVFHCDSLLLCTTRNNRRHVVVWNPCLGETKWIQLKTCDPGYHSFALGYENNQSCRSYKILRWYYHGDRVVVLEMYDFGSDSWRNLDLGALNCCIQQNDVSFKGDTYWLARIDSKSDLLLVSFDFTSESFRRLCLPAFQDPGWMSLSVVREERLLVLHRNFGASKIEMWVANEIDTEAVRWSKCFTMDMVAPIHSYPSRFPMRFLFDEEKKVAVCCDGYVEGSKVIYTIQKYYTEAPFVETTQVSCCPFIFSYVPSLVQIPEKEREKKRIN
ncbi:unnamed protein product [Microthlaspi erraticum]|uniref:F-box domain-containing protein n=1 Tax=Microthlaspi erraticum TaxID=1685480 RepID=A0A6D2K225_9BRAS|nr:unnamed protein product [Microthlaspi erraticum]